MPRCTASASDGVYRARELNQETIAHRLDDASMVIGDGGIDQLLAVTFQGAKSTDLIEAHRVANSPPRQLRRSQRAVVRLGVLPWSTSFSIG